MGELEEGYKSYRKLSKELFLGCKLFDALVERDGEIVVDLIFNKGANPNVIIPEYGVAPIHCAAGIDPEEFGLGATRACLDCGGDPNAECDEGVTPVHVAAVWGRTKVLALLLGKGGDPLRRDADGATPLDLARREGHREAAAVMERFRKGDLVPVPILSPPPLDLLPSDLHLGPDSYSLLKKHREGVQTYQWSPRDPPSDAEEETPPTEIPTPEFSLDSLKKHMNSVFGGQGVHWHSPEIVYECINSDPTGNGLSKVSENILQQREFALKQSENTRKQCEIVLKKPKHTLKQLENLFKKPESTLSKHSNRSRTNTRKPEAYSNFPNSIDTAANKLVQSSSKYFTPKCSPFNSGLKLKPKAVSNSGENLIPTPLLLARSKPNNSKFYGSSEILTTPLSSRSSIDLNRSELFYTPPETRSPSHDLIRMSLDHYQRKTISLELPHNKSKKSLYQTGYEYWSTRIKSFSFPTMGPTDPNENFNGNRYFIKVEQRTTLV